MTNQNLAVRSNSQNNNSQNNEGRNYAPRVPSADVFESGTELRIVMDVPGVEASDLDITVEAEELRVMTEGPHRYHRHFRVPDFVDAEGIEAAVRDGVLTLTLPKVPAVQPRKVEVRTS